VTVSVGVKGLQPTLLEESGLIAALQKLVERSHIPGWLRCNFLSTGIPEESLPPSVQKGLSNPQAGAEHLGAQLEVRTSKGHGTRIVVRLPIVH
jgi:signal transduction histidine kinase